MWYLASPLRSWSSDLDWSHRDQILWHGCIHDSSFFWNACQYLFDHSLVCVKLILSFDKQKTSGPKWIGVSKSAVASIPTKYQTEIGLKLVVSPLKSSDEHKMNLLEGLRLLRFAKCPAFEHWNAAGSLRPLGTPRSTPANRKFDGKKHMLT